MATQHFWGDPARKESAMQATSSNESRTSNRGFASMSTDRQREIARKGGRAAHAKGTAHEFTSDEARSAGQKGGQRVSANREHMSRIGRIGGKKSAGRRQEMKSSGGDNSPDGDFGGGQPGRDAGESMSSAPEQSAPSMSMQDSQSSNEGGDENAA